MPPRKRASSGKQTKPALQVVSSVKPNPLIWKIALKAAQGDTSRIEVVSEDEVIVHN